MTCSVGKPRGRRATEIAGTWDFKWPLGTEIRVAFQRPPDLDSKSDFDQARLEVIALAQRWEDAISQRLASSKDVNAAAFFCDGIRLAFPEDLIFDAPGRYEHIVPEEHRSPFLTVDERRLRYDVLVSFEDLPLNRHRTGRATQGDGPPPGGVHDVDDVGIERVAGPISELGCYARRRDFGMPTVYIGRFGQLQGVPLHEFYTYPLAQHVVVHEFGHVLGLAHEHQNPHLDRTPYRPAREIRSTYAKIFQSTPSGISDRDIMEQVTDAWPGSTDFSDWDDCKGHGEPTLYNLDSIMTYPFHHLFLEPRPRLADAASRNDALPGVEQVEKNLTHLMDRSSRGDKPNGHPDLHGLLTHPTDRDVINLVRMYAPPAAGRRHRRRAAQQ